MSLSSSVPTVLLPFVVGIVLLMAILVMLGILLWRSRLTELRVARSRSTTPLPFVSKAWQWGIERFAVLHLDFGPQEHQKHLTLTFNFLSGLVWLLIALTGVWAVAAGVIKSGHLAVDLGGAANAASPLFPTTSWFWQTTGLFVPFLAAVVYAAEAFGVAMLVCIASVSGGAILGFLFGVPRPISENPQPPPAIKDPVASPTAPGSLKSQEKPQTGSGLQGPGWQSSTNLTQISDWLTKIIIGVGLVDFHRLTPTVHSLVHFVGIHLLQGIAGTQLVLPSLIIAGAVFGFMYSYLFTQLFLAGLMAYSAWQLGVPEALYAKEAMLMAAIDPADPMIAPSARGVLTPEPTPEVKLPTDIQKAAADKLRSQPLSSLSDPDALWAWARAQAVADDYAAAATGYNKLLTISRQPKVLAEASRVIARADNVVEARALIEEAAAKRDMTDKTTRARITFDAANYALYDPPPGGYTHALTLLDDDTLNDDTSGGLHVLRACALGQRHAFERGNLTDAAKDDLRDAVRRNLETAATKTSRNTHWILYLLNQSDGPPVDDGAASGSGDRVVDDDLKDFYQDPTFAPLVARLRGLISSTTSQG